MRFTLVLLASVLLTPSLSITAWSELEPLRVFVRIDPELEGQANSSKRKELYDSVRDLREQIRKRPDLADADERGRADILVTLLDRRLEVNRAGVNDYGGALKQQHYQSRYVLVSLVEAGAFHHESETALAGAFVTWKRVAGVLAKDIEDWSKHYRDDMLAGTPPH